MLSPLIFPFHDCFHGLFRASEVTFGGDFLWFLGCRGSRAQVVLEKIETEQGINPTVRACDYTCIWECACVCAREREAYRSRICWLCGLTVIRVQGPSRSRLRQQRANACLHTRPPECAALIRVRSVPQIRALCCAAGTGCMRKEGVCAWPGGRGQSVTWRKVSASTPPAPTTARAFRESAYAVQPTRAPTVSKVRHPNGGEVAPVRHSASVMSVNNTSYLCEVPLFLKSLLTCLLFYFFFYLFFFQSATSLPALTV